jgi:hypothetical protein
LRAAADADADAAALSLIAERVADASRILAAV